MSDEKQLREQERARGNGVVTTDEPVAMAAVGDQG